MDNVPDLDDSLFLCNVPMIVVYFCSLTNWKMLVIKYYIC